MDQLNCSICNNRVPGSLNGLSDHLIRVHGLTISRGVGANGFECGQDGCRKRYIHFYSLRKHIRERHLLQPNQRFEEAIVPDQDFYYDDNEVVNARNVSDNDQVGNQRNVLDDQDNILVHPNNENTDFDLRQLIVRMIARFQSKGSVTGTLLTDVLNEFEQVVLSMQNFFKMKVLTFFQNKQLLDDEEAKLVLIAFEFNNPFDGLRSLNEQIDVLKEYCNYIEPEEIPLGYRLDQVLDRKTGTYKPKLVMDVCQYVPILKTLELILSSPDVRSAIENEERSHNGFLESYLDGQHVHVHPLFSQYPHALRIQLYYDDFEVVNPLGSKTSVHKLGGFYFTIQNLPPHMNSQLNSIHTLCLCSTIDVGKYGYENILAPFFKDLNELESDEGVRMNIDGNEYIIRASIVGFCGDGLAVHDIFNLLGPSATHFCRLCMYNRHDLHEGSLNLGPERSEILHNSHLALLKNTNYSDTSITATGIRGNSCLHQSRYFHITRNKIFDPMHDFLCGICPMILKLVLNEYVLVQRLFSIDTFNARISSFSYGVVEQVNKPSANFTDNMLRKRDHSLSQKAMQVWLLMRTFPFLMHGLIPNSDEYMKFFINLLQIMELTFAPKLTYSIIPYLHELIKKFFITFQRLFPNVNPINKFHHLLHYPDCIMWSGPLIHYWCMRYEAKHNTIKSRAHNVCNFKNPSKTLVRIVQSGQSAKWGMKNVKLSEVTTSCLNKSRVIDRLSRTFLNDLHYHDNDEIYYCTSVKINGVQFRLNLYVCVETACQRDDDMPLFGENINGAAFLELTEDDLKDLKIKLGPRKILLKIINSTKKLEIIGSYVVQEDGLLTSPVLKESTVSNEQHILDQNIIQPQPHCSKDNPLTVQSSNSSCFSRYGTVKETLKNHPQGLEVLEAAESSFTEKHRKSLIRITVTELVKVYDSYYPPDSAKTALAKAIVAEFSRLRNDYSFGGYEHYYDQKTKKGFIEFRLWTMRTKLSPSKKKYKKTAKENKISNVDIENISIEEMNEKISMMKFKNPTEENKKIIIKALEDTHVFRRHWIIVEMPTLAQIFQTYPRLRDYNGEMIDIEFKKMFPELIDNLISKFPGYYVPRILQYAKKFHTEVFKKSKKIEDEQLRALLILTELLPVSNAVKNRKNESEKSSSKGKKRLYSDRNNEEEDVPLKSNFPNKELLQFVSEGTNVEHFEKSIRNQSDQNIQPYLIFLNGQGGRISFIQGDGLLLRLPESFSPLQGFDILYKFFYVFNLEYPRTLLNFYNFMDKYIYKMSLNPHSVVSSLHINICNVNMEESNSSN